MKYTARQPQSNVNVTPSSPLREFFVLAGGLFIIVVGIYFLLGLAVDLMVPYLPVTFEKKLAVVFVKSLKAKPADSSRQQYVQSLMDQLQTRCAQLPYKFQVHVLQSPTINALALPGGNVIIFTGLLEKVTSENELSFVLAHEMGHYAHQDHLRAVGRSMVFMTLSAVIFGADSGISKLIGTGLNVTELSFSRKQETRADEFALEAVNCAYGHVEGAVDFFSRIPKEQDPGIFGHYFSSHPENTRRIAHLKDLTASRGYKLLKKLSLPASLRPLKK